MTTVVPVNPVTGKPYAAPPPKKPGKPLKPGKTTSTVSPEVLKTSYDNWTKAHPGAGGKGKSAFQKWLSGQGGGGGPPAVADDPWNPLAGQPQQTPLTPFPMFDASTLPDGSDVPNTPGRQFKPGQAQLLDPNKFADMVGAKSFKPLIDALTSQQGRLGSGVADANAMLDKSYGDASAGSLRGAQIVADSNKQANQSLTDLAARMASVAGGDPTAAAAVGQATANQQASDTRFANAASQTQADQAAAAQRDLGTAKLGYKSSTDKAIADLASVIGSTKAQAGQAQGKALEEALGFNSNQQTAQQGRDVAAQEAWLAGQLAGPQITAGKLANEGTRAGLKINAHNVEVNDWTSLNSAKRQSYLDSVTKWTNKNVAQQMKTALASGKTPGAELALADPEAWGAMKSGFDQSFTTKSGPAVDPGKTYSSIVRQMHSQYPDSSSAAIKALALRYVSTNLDMWNAQHDKGQQNSGKTWKIVKGAPALVKA